MTYDGATGRSTFRIRGLDGKTLREFSHVQGGGWTWQKDWIYRDGQLLGTDSAASGVRHAHNDHLGTPRVFSDVFGNYQERRHLYPFGEQALATGPAPVTMTFTGHERDGNWTTGTADDLDYMMARYYHPQLGRFLSTDPSRESFDPKLPSSWNRYTYVFNKPLSLTDPNGELPTLAVGAATGAAGGVIFQVVLNELSDRPTFEGVGREALSGAAAGATGVGLLKVLNRGRQALKVTRAAKTLKQLRTIGRAGKSSGIREVAGDAKDAKKLFNALRGSNSAKEVKPGVFVAEGQNGGTVTFRAASKSGPATVDINSTQTSVRKVKFLEEI